MGSVKSVDPYLLTDPTHRQTGGVYTTNPAATDFLTGGRQGGLGRDFET